MKRIVALAIVLVAACQDTPPVAAPLPVAKPTPTKPAPMPPKAGKLTTISLDALFPRQQAGTVLLYDARPGFVAGFGKIPGSISWPKNDFDARLSQSEAEIRAAKAAGTPVVIYCTDAACPDAGAVANKLVARGHDVSILDGGFAAWKEAGLPTE
jgi:rhodanese-related sulfurtransferase